MPDSHSKASRTLYNLRKEVKTGLSREGQKPLSEAQLNTKKRKIAELVPLLGRRSQAPPTPPPRVIPRRPRVINAPEVVPTPVPSEPEMETEPETEPGMETEPEALTPTEPELHLVPVELDKLELKLQADLQTFNFQWHVSNFPDWFIDHKRQQLNRERAKRQELMTELRRQRIREDFYWNTADWHSTQFQLTMCQQQIEHFGKALALIDPPCVEDIRREYEASFSSYFRA